VYEIDQNASVITQDMSHILAAYSEHAYMQQKKLIRDKVLVCHTAHSEETLYDCVSTNLLQHRVYAVQEVLSVNEENEHHNNGDAAVFPDAAFVMHACTIQSAFRKWQTRMQAEQSVAQEWVLPESAHNTWSNDENQVSVSVHQTGSSHNVIYEVISDDMMDPRDFPPHLIRYPNDFRQTLRTIS
jgi:hypothetical protein